MIKSIKDINKLYLIGGYMYNLISLLDNSFSNTYNKTFFYDYNLSESSEKYVYEINMPGLNINDIEISVENLLLKIETKTKPEDKKFIFRGRINNPKNITFNLPKNSNIENIEAYIDNGILTIDIPKDIKMNKSIKLLQR